MWAQFRQHQQLGKIESVSDRQQVRILFSKWARNSRYKYTVFLSLRFLGVQAQNRATLSALNVWKVFIQQNKIQQFKIIEKEKKQQIVQLQKRVDVLQDILEKEGITKCDVVKQIIKHERPLSTPIQRSECEVIQMDANYIDRNEKIYMQEIYETTALQISARLHNPKTAYFKKWKFQCREKVEQRENKQQMISRISRQKHEISQLESSILTLQEYIDEIEKLVQLLERNVHTGQAMVCNYLHYKHQTLVRHAWQTIIYSIHKDRIHEYRGQLANLRSQDDQFLNKQSQLSMRMKDLEAENEELRQASMEGIQIAQCIEQLSQEKEDLSKELVSRSDTIQRLLQDNNHLSLRLTTAQKEAEQLVMLTSKSLYSTYENAAL